MGVLRPIVDRFQSTGETQTAPSDRILTPATIMTASRPWLAYKTGQRLVRGQKGAIKYAALMAVSDMEGTPARLFDKYLPDLHIGRSKFGGEADQYADALALIILGGAILAAPRVHPLGKAATALVIGQEGTKALWAFDRAWEYKQLMDERLVIPTLDEGKEAMAEKLVAVTLAVATNEFDNPYVRTTLGTAALGFAASGSWRGERVRQEYEATYQEMVNPLLSLQPEPA